MKRLIAVLLLVFILIGVALFEELYINNFLNTFNEKSQQLSSVIDIDNKDLERSDVETKYNELNSYWNNKKNVLCLFTNYEKIKTIDESFVKLKTAIKNNDSSLAIENIAVIKEYRQFFNYFMGFNLNNLF